MEAVINAEMNDDGLIVLKVESKCPYVMKLAEALGPIDFMAEMNGPINMSSVYSKAGTTLPHIACPLPCAMIKSLEVASGMGLKRDVTMKIE